MRAGEASRTAVHMAFFRALESVRAAADRLFEDPFAARFLDRRLHLVLQAARLPGLARLIPRIIDRGWPGALSSGVGRTRFIDEALRAALRDIEQLVILGAGFDCRAYRLSGVERLRVFEVDHPDSLARKRATLAAALPSMPAHVRFVPVDFNREELSAAMERAGYDAARRTFFLWEGVTHYLTADAVDGVMRWFGRAARTSRVVFTYIHRQVLDDPASYRGAARILRTVQRSGEPWTFGLDPAAVPEYLAARGLRLIEDLGATEYRARSFGPRSHSMRGYEFYRVAVATVEG